MFKISTIQNYLLKIIFFSLINCFYFIHIKANSELTIKENKAENELFKDHDKLSTKIEKINKLENYVNDYTKFTNSLSNDVKKEIEEFNKVSNEFSIEKKKAYNSLSNEAKKFLKEEKIAKKNIVLLMQEKENNNNIILKNTNDELSKIDLSNLNKDNSLQPEKIVSEPEHLEKLKEAISEYSKVLSSLDDNVKKELDEYRSLIAKINLKNQELYRKLGKDSKEYLKKNRMHKKAIMQMLSK
ncbi:MAG: hypothetical protein U1E31_01455 [Rickettsiales bacterium]